MISNIKMFIKNNKKIYLIFPLIAVLLLIIGSSVLLIYEGNRIKSKDEIAFYDIAKNIAVHGKFAHTNNPDLPFYNSTIPEGKIRKTAYRAPGYVFFITPFVKLKADYTFLRILNFILVIITFILLYIILTKYFSLNSGLVFCILFFSYPILLYTASILYPQTLQAFLLVLNFYFMMKINKESKILPFIFIGITSGLLILTVPINLLLMPLFILWIFFARKPKFLYLIITCLIIISIMGTWTVRNYIVYKTFIPVATSAGFNLIYGNSPNTRYNTSQNILIDDRIFEEAKNKTDAQQNKIFTKAAFQYIRENPKRYIILYFQKFLHWFHFENKLLSDTVIEGGASKVMPSFRSIIMFLTYIPLLLLLLIRIFLIKFFKISDFEILIILTYICAGLAYAIFFTRIRFRIPFDYLLLSINAIFIGNIIKKLLKIKSISNNDSKKITQNQ